LHTLIAEWCARLSANAPAGVTATARKILSTAQQIICFMVGFLDENNKPDDGQKPVAEL
jgi:hypothetical protein